MKRKLLPNQKKNYKELQKRLNGYTRKIIPIFSTLALEASKIAVSVDYDTEGMFRFSDFPKTEKKVNRLFNYFFGNIQALIYSGISEEWKNSNEIQDLLARRVLKSFTRQIGEKKEKAYFEKNNAAKEAFKKRSINGLNLSQRLWKQREDIQRSLEYAISTGIEKGMSAVKLSKRVSKYLNDYPALAKDYKKKYGKAIDISSCEYRSVRLARNEINMAYRIAEQERWRKMDFIKGKQIRTSGSHGVSDMCDKLQGDYPLFFDWDGWHVNCRCYAIPIIMSEKEYWNEDVNQKISTVPDGFDEYLKVNEKKLLGYKTKPRFIENNERYIKSTALLKDKRRLEYNKLKKDNSYTDVSINDNGGLKATHINHSTHPNDNKRYFEERLNGDEIEKSFYDLVFQNGKSVIFCNEKEKINGGYVTSLDMIYNGVRMDLKSITEDVKDYRNHIVAKNKQANRWNKIYNDNVDTVCLYFYEPKLYSEQKVINGYKRFVGFTKKAGKKISIKNIICVVKNGDAAEEHFFSF